MADNAKIKNQIEIVKTHHLNYIKANSEALQHAKECGEALIILGKLRKKDNGEEGPTRIWFNRRFKGVFSYETSRNYIRVAKYWNDPRVIQARQNGLETDSIKKFLEVLRKKRLSDPEEYNFAKMTLKERINTIDRLGAIERESFYLCHTRQAFNELFRELSYEELWMAQILRLVDNDGIFDKIRDILKDAFQKQWGYRPPHDDCEDSLNTEERKKQDVFFEKEKKEWIDHFASAIEASEICPESISWIPEKKKFWINEEKLQKAKEKLEKAHRESA